MRAGSLRHKVELIAPTSARAADGSIENTEVSLGIFYAAVATESLSETSQEDKLVSVVGHKITLRYNSTDLTAISGNSKIIVDGQTLHVLSATVKDYKDRMIEVVAEARL